MRRIILVLIFMGILYLPFSCSNYECSTTYISITELAVDFGVLQDEFYNFFPRETTTWDSAAFRISIAESEIDSIIAVNTTGLFPAAYAESPPICPSELSSKLQSVTITSTSDISVGVDVYPAGENLNSLFDAVYEYDYSRQTDLDNISGDLLEEPMKFSETYRSIYFELIARPTEPVEGAFIFTFTFDDRTLTVTSEVISISD